MTVATESVSQPLPVATFDALYRAEFGRVTRIARRIVGDQAEAEDVAQEIFASLARRPQALDANVPAWLHLTAVRRALDAARSRHRRSAREERAAPDPAWRDDDADPLDIIVRAERVSAIRAIMRRLKARDAALLAMRYGGDLSYREIAEAIAVPPEHVAPLLDRARRAFAREVHRAPRALILALVTTVVVLLTLSALPPARAFATDIARRLHFAPAVHTLFRPGGMLFIGSDLQRLTASTSRTETRRMPGFRVRIPAQPAAPRRSAQRVDVGPYRLHTTYRLDSARARAAGMTLPPDLDGATIDVAVGPWVNVEAGHDPARIDRPAVAVSQVATPVVVITHTTARRIAEWIARDRTIPNGLYDVLRGLSDPFVALPLPKPFVGRFPRRSARHVHVDGVDGIAVTGDGSSYVAWIKHGVVYVAGGRDALDHVLAVANSLR